jgi:hypothetical protein
LTPFPTSVVSIVDTDINHFISFPNIADLPDSSGSVSIKLPSDQTTNQLIVKQPSSSTQSSISKDQLRSVIIDVSLAQDLPKGSMKAQICLEYTNQQNGESDKDLCLGYFDEQKKEWICEDSCLKRNKTSNAKDSLCGNTDHFTSFAILLVGGSVKGSKCGEVNQAYVTGSWRGDAGLVGAVVVLVLVIAFLILALSYIPALDKVFYGREGARVRENRMRFSAGNEITIWSKP